MLCYEYRMAFHRSLLAIIGNERGGKTFPYEIFGMFSYLSDSFAVYVFNIFPRKMEARSECGA